VALLTPTNSLYLLLYHRFITLKKRIIFFLLLAGFLSLAASGRAGFIEVSGAVSGVWQSDTVKVMNHIEIRSADTLYIRPGVTVLFCGAYHFAVHGRLIARGSVSHPVVFTAADTTGFHNDTLPLGGWRQIRVESLSPGVDSVVFDYCRFEYGKAIDSDSIHGYGGALCIRNTDKVVVTHSEFINNYAFFNGGAIYLHQAPIAISGSRFIANRCGQATVYYGYGGALCSDSSTAHISQNYFHLNSSTGIGGGLCVRFADCNISRNIFDDNYSALGGGLGMLHIDACYATINSNLVVNNSAMFFGGGISNGNCSPTYVNNTIVANHCEGGGGGFYCKDSVVPVLVNNILYHNTQYGGDTNQVYLWDFLSQPDFYYNDVQGGTEDFDGTGGADFLGAYVHNTDSDPEFIGNTFIPGENSPCINAGDPDTTGLMIIPYDLAGLQRLIGDTIDMGVYEWQIPAAVADKFFPDNLTLLHLYPNPVVHTLNLELFMSSAGHVALTLTNLGGNLVEKLFEGNLNAGEHRFSHQITTMQPGVYLVKCATADRTLVEKVTVLGR